MKTRRALISLTAALALVALVAGRPAAGSRELLVTTDWLAEHLSDSHLTILHVATSRAHYDKGHIPGARFVAWSEITAARAGVPNELPPVADLVRIFERLGVGDEGRIVLYGDQKGLSAARGYFTLDYLGHGDRAALLDGGLEQWRAEKRPVSTDAPTVSSRPFSARVTPDVVVGLDAVRDISWSATHQTPAPWVLIDARPSAQFSGEVPGDGIPRPGHIPGAKNIFWEEHFASNDVPVLRPIAELRALYERAGAAPGIPLVTYCRTGGQSAHAYFVAKYLGFDVRMYDGSFIEWSRADGTEVAGR
jgi:thiosulfate/3-mercaptopyruvate sulfurtransferase